MSKKIFSNFTDAFAGVGNAIKLGQKRAMNRAASSTKTFISKEIRSEVGLKAKDINKRLIVNKTQSGMNKTYSFQSSVGIATRIGHPLRMFSPRTKKVKVKTKRYGSTRQGVTVKLSKGNRVFVPNAFLMNVRGNEIVAMRKGDKRKPTAEVRTGIFIDTVMAGLIKFKTYFTKEYKRIVNAQVKYAVDQRLSKNMSED